MEWYIPITILPAVGLLVLSTANLLIALNNEISALHKEDERYITIIRKKLTQLKFLNLALIGEYSSAFLMVLAGIIGGLLPNQKFNVYIVLLAVFSLSLSIAILINYSIHSLRIRQEHLKI